MECYLKRVLDETINDFIAVLALYGKETENAHTFEELQNTISEISSHEVYVYKIKSHIVASNDEDLINYLIGDLKYYHNKTFVTKKDLINVYEIIEAALSSLERITPSDERQEIYDLYDAIDVKYKKLSSQLYGTNPSSSKTLLSNKNKGKKDKEEKDFVRSRQLRIIESISPNLDARSKITFYINKVFISLFSDYWFLFCQERKKMSFEEIKKILENALNSNGTRKNDLLQQYKKEFINKDASLKEVQNEIKQFFIENGDIQLWSGIFHKGPKETSSYRKIDSVFHKLNCYRNSAIHLGTSEVNSIWVIFTLEEIISFAKAKFVKQEIQASYLEKHLFFERYATFGNKLGKTAKEYSDVDFRYVNQKDFEEVLSWTDVLTSTQFMPVSDCERIISDNHEEEAKFVSNLFFPEKGKPIVQDNIRKLLKYYKSNSFLFSSFVMSEKFDKLLEAGYPFHPAFFIITKGLSIESVVKLASRALINNMHDLQKHYLIMPCDMLPSEETKELISEFDDEICKEFTSTDVYLADNYTGLDGWNFFASIELNKNSVLFTDLQRPELLVRVAKSIILLNLYQWRMPKPVKDFTSTRDIIRFLILEPYIFNLYFEEAIDFLEKDSFLLEHNGSKYIYKTVSDFDKQDKLLSTLYFDDYDYERALINKMIASLKEKYPCSNVFLYDSEYSLSKYQEGKQNIILFEPYRSVYPPESFHLSNKIKEEDIMYEVSDAFAYFDNVLLPLRCSWIKSIICEVIKKDIPALFDKVKGLDFLRWENYDIDKFIQKTTNIIGSHGYY